MAMKRLLALTFYLPPVVLPRSIQVSRTLKALRGFGWESDAVTIAPPPVLGQVRDARLAAYYDGCYRRFTSGASGLQWLMDVLRGGTQPSRNHVETTAAACLKQIERNRYDAFVTFAQPWSSHVAGLLVKERHGDLRWLAHFSDPWVDSPYYSAISPEIRALWSEQERSVIEKADAVVFTTSQIAERVMGKYPQQYRTKVHIVPHGYDPGLLSPRPTSARSTRVPRFVYAGSFYGIRSPQPLFDALLRLRRVMPLEELPEIYCQGASKIKHRVAAWKLGLGRNVRFKPEITYLECLAVLQQADALLLIDAPSKESMFLPSKIVDYLMVQRPIIGITPSSGASADMLRTLGCPCVDPEDSRGLADLLAAGTAKWHATGNIEEFMPDSVVTLRYHIDHTTEHFAAALG